MRRLPSRVCLPFGYRISVRQLTDTEMRAQDEKKELQDGLWDAGKRLIMIRRSLPVARKKYILGHELIHAVLDYIHECLNDTTMRP
jgi:Zn-dependent peptidase ImmA (M78 family)